MKFGPYSGRWLDRNGVVHADNPWFRKIHAINPWDPGADSRMYIGNASVSAWEYGKRRNACGRSSMALHKYLPRKTMPTCLTCFILVLHETPRASSTQLTSRRRR